MKKILLLILSITLPKSIQSMEFNNPLTLQGNNFDVCDSYVIGIPVTTPVDTICKHFSLILQNADKQSNNHYINLLNFTIPHKMLPDIETILTRYTKEFELFTVEMAPKVIRKNNELYWYPNMKDMGYFLLKKIALELAYRLQNSGSNISNENTNEEPHIVFDDIKEESHNILCNYLATDEFSIKFPATGLTLIKTNQKTNSPTIINTFPFHPRPIPSFEEIAFSLWNTLQSIRKD